MSQYKHAVHDVYPEANTNISDRIQIKKITTVEGLDKAPIQDAFVNNWSFQCDIVLGVSHGMSCIEQHTSRRNDYVIEQWLQSNLCRCTGFEEIK